MRNEARIARAEVCDEIACTTGDLLVRGDLISFVSCEQVRKVGDHPLDDRKMPSDITLPKKFVLVHDTSQVLFDFCSMHFCAWRGGRHSIARVDPGVHRTARKYFGEGVPIKGGDIELPEGKWKRIAKIAYIRYRRAGKLAAPYEHPFKPPVWLYASQEVLGWRLVLPKGCIVDERGFVRP